MMHFEVLIEDASGKILIEAVVDRLLDADHAKSTWRLHKYKGVGRLPKNLAGSRDPAKRILLDNVPRLLRGYAKSLVGIPAAVIIVLDLDAKDEQRFRAELGSVIESSAPDLSVAVFFAIEEMEAWLLGDPEALLSAFPMARRNVLQGYEQDAICGTWELLADAIYAGGSRALKAEGWPASGIVKCAWSSAIAPFMDLDANRSPSFCAFRDGIRTLAAG